MPPPPPTALPGPSIATAPRPGGLPGPKAVIPPSPASNGNTNKAPASIPASRPAFGIQAANPQQIGVLQKPALPKPGAIAKNSTLPERQGGIASASVAPVPPGGSLGVRPLGLPSAPQAIPGKPRAPAPPKAPASTVAQSSTPATPHNSDNKTSSASSNKLPGGQLPGPARLPMPATPQIRPATGPTRPPPALPGPSVYSKSGTSAPPRSLPSFVGARAGPSETGFSAPPPPSGLPSVPSVPRKVGENKPSSASTTSTIPLRPLPPSAPEKAEDANSGKSPGILSPSGSTTVQEDASGASAAKFKEEQKEGKQDTPETASIRKQPEEKPEEDASTPEAAKKVEDAVEDGHIATDWKQCLHDLGDSDEEQASDASIPVICEDSGEDSDTAATANLDVDRHKNDMHVLLRQQPRKFHAKQLEQEPESQEQKTQLHVGREPRNPSEEDVSHGQSLEAKGGPVIKDNHVELACGEQQKAAAQHQGSGHQVAEEEKGGLLVTRDLNGPTEGDATGEGFQKKGTLISRFFGVAAKSVGGSSPINNSMLEEDISEHPDSWYAQQLAQLSKGKPCTKVATNGKPYERHFYVDAKNLTIEIQGGKGGCTGILLDDLVDILRGLSSSEFQRFAARVKHEESLPDVAERAIVLKALHRTFSFIFSSAAQRQIVAHSLLFLLKSRNRGVMACTPSGNSVAVSASAQAGAAGASKKCPKQGVGSVTYVNRSSYEGEFQNHLRHGHGILTLSDGTRYESEWRHDERHGPGKEVCPDGTTFEGSYVKGMRHGHGVMTWPEGSQYSGQFERGRANGEGQLLRTDGSVYKGQFVEDCMSGEGRMQWRDGVEYKGQFVQNRREGQGTMLWTSGRWKSYMGAWKDGMQHGPGTLCDHRDQEFPGLFRQGKLERWEEGEGA